MKPQQLRASLLCATAFAIVASCVGCAERNPAPTLSGVIAERDLDPGVHVGGLAIAPNGDIWLATLNYGNGPAGVIRVGAHGTMQRFARIESFNRVAVDARGIAWLTVGAGAAGQQPKLLRIDGSGKMREYPLPSEGNFQGIAIGPDGAAWYVNALDGEIGRIGSDSAITYYGPATADPTEIVAGSDGNLWFSEPKGNHIGRLHPDGSIKEFAVPSIAARPTAVTLGADGNVWFCETAANKVARITPDGRITEFPLKTADAWPSGIAAARNGTIWFTELLLGNVGRLDKNGKVTEFALPGGGYPGPIARAPDGSLWIAINAKRDAALGLTTSRSRLIHFAPR